MSNQDGMGVMINKLFGRPEETAAAVAACMGKTIAKVVVLKEGDGTLVITFTGDTSLSIWDDGRSCCESRYLTCDDALDDFIGAVFNQVEVNQAPDIETEWGEVHEQGFLIVTTSIGRFTVTTHNQHNGYYGGFYLKAAIGLPEERR